MVKYIGYIYKITNDINRKIYIGKTQFSIEKRFKEHCSDSLKERCEKRPLYDAFNKYGIENFKIEELEQIEDNSKLSEREVYWIQELQTYGKEGYNASKGGDGILLYDHNEILELYNLGYNSAQIAGKIGCERTLVTKVLRAHGIKSRGNSQIIEQYDLNENYIQTFDSTMKARDWLFENNITSNKQCRNVILRCCKGENKSAYGYIWKYKELPK